MAMYKQLSATATVKDGAARLVSLTVCSTSSGTIKIYDNTAASGSVLLETLTPAAGAHFYWGEDGLATNTGIHVVIANTLVVTIGYK